MERSARQVDFYSTYSLSLSLFDRIVENNHKRHDILIYFENSRMSVYSNRDTRLGPVTQLIIDNQKQKYGWVL